MVKIFENLIGLISDPVIVAIVLAFGLTIVVLWRLFDKQHQFIMERLDLLRKENEDLRSQLQIFKEENKNLKESSNKLSESIESLRKQPLLTDQQVMEMRRLADSARELSVTFPENQEMVRQVLENIRKAILEMLQEVSESSHMSARIQQKAFEDLSSAIKQGGPIYGEILHIVNDLVSAVTENQTKSSLDLERIRERALMLTKEIK